MNDTQNPPVAASEGTGTLHITPGEMVKINWPGNEFHSLEGEYKHSSGYNDTYYIQFGPDSAGWFDISKIEAIPQLWPANATMEEMREVVRRVNNDLAEAKLQAESRLQSLQREQERLTEQQRRYRSDMQHIESVLMEAKESEGWCDEGWNRYAEQVNDGLRGGWQFDLMEQEFELEVEITGTMRTTTTITVTASSEEAAWEAFDRDQDSYIDADDLLTDAARSASFDDIEFDRA